MNVMNNLMLKVVKQCNLTHKETGIYLIVLTYYNRYMHTRFPCINIYNDVKFKNKQLKYKYIYIYILLFENKQSMLMEHNK